METETYQIAPAQFSAYLAELPAQGIAVEAMDASHGTATMSDYVIGYSYDGKTLTLTGQSKPWLSYPWSVVFGRISEHLS